MDDLGELKPIAELAALLPLKYGKPQTAGNIRRWIARGIRGVRLNGRRIGGQWHSSQAALEEFFRLINADQPAARMRDSTRHAMVQRELEAEGFFGPRERRDG